uniref:Uncharacterized protein n=1 Tax=Lepeophtheirus salmonis TaxID=72036 RepID=A0A0K2U8K5_LEPSM
MCHPKILICLFFILSIVVFSTQSPSVIGIKSPTISSGTGVNDNSPTGGLSSIPNGNNEKPCQKFHYLPRLDKYICVAN